ncbi:MAG: hypothetical protein PT116_03260, partial [Aphanizomenon gracile PMC638.10]|nr:hypothetical protein [Aphanizomenon gracile PMC638.10]
QALSRQFTQVTNRLGLIFFQFNYICCCVRSPTTTYLIPAERFANALSQSPNSELTSRHLRDRILQKPNIPFLTNHKASKNTRER